MKHPHKLTFGGVLLVVLLGTGFVWFQIRLKAEETASSDDKWTQIQNNNKKMFEDLQTVEETLQFAKARAMQGSHRP